MKELIQNAVQVTFDYSGNAVTGYWLDSLVAPGATTGAHNVLALISYDGRIVTAPVESIRLASNVTSMFGRTAAA